ncbi:interferon beta [Rousettus aegyptiacus]|uniref:Interferon beta 1 n=2 Tax=Rousettus aegyptiacus TaxID=9407 RepID=A0A7J8IL83_ROUAE|nr:interferon beta [Rousettus aegyptiacus]KAF6484925.1 interferon beta 1 [Rousettus aegyptiacus]
MTNRCILQIALLLCFSTTALSMSYDLLRFQQRSSNLACLKLLWRLNGTPQYCLKDRMDFKIPAEIKQPQQLQKEDAVLIIREMLQQILGILQRNFSSTGWNETIIENLLVKLDKQIDLLDTALEKLKKENFTWESMTVSHLENYYFRIMRYLKIRLYSRCAWTVVRAEILRNFSFLIGLTEYLRN